MPAPARLEARRPTATASTADIIVDELKVWNQNVAKLVNLAGQQEAICVMGFGGLFDSTTGDCKVP